MKLDGPEQFTRGETKVANDNAEELTKDADQAEASVSPEAAPTKEVDYTIKQIEKQEDDAPVSAVIDSPEEISAISEERLKEITQPTAGEIATRNVEASKYSYEPGQRSTEKNILEKDPANVVSDIFQEDKESAFSKMTSGGKEYLGNLLQHTYDKYIKEPVTTLHLKNEVLRNNKIIHQREYQEDRISQSIAKTDTKRKLLEDQKTNLNAGLRDDGTDTASQEALKVIEEKIQLCDNRKIELEEKLAVAKQETESYYNDRAAYAELIANKLEEKLTPYKNEVAKADALLKVHEEQLENMEYSHAPLRDDIAEWTNQRDAKEASLDGLPLITKFKIKGEIRKLENEINAVKETIERESLRMNLRGENLKRFRRQTERGLKQHHDKVSKYKDIANGKVPEPETKAARYQDTIQVKSNEGKNETYVTENNFEPHVEQREKESPPRTVVEFSKKWQLFLKAQSEAVLKKYTVTPEELTEFDWFKVPSSRVTTEGFEHLLKKMAEKQPERFTKSDGLIKEFIKSLKDNANKN